MRMNRFDINSRNRAALSFNSNQRRRLTSESSRPKKARVELNVIVGVCGGALFWVGLFIRYVYKYRCGLMEYVIV